MYFNGLQLCKIKSCFQFAVTQKLSYTVNSKINLVTQIEANLEII
jgi:hypothetical protein